MNMTITTPSEAEQLADAILRLSGSNLRNYTLPKTRQAIIKAAQHGIDKAISQQDQFNQEASMTNILSHDEIRKRHFEHLHSYIQSAEYATYAGEPQNGLPSLLGNRWEIDAETYMEFLEVLPPLAYRGGSFYMSEFSFGDITTKYTKEGEKYWCEFAHYPERKPSHPITSPWGKPDTIKEIAPGIVHYSTPSHGGFWLSDARIATMPKPLRDFVPFGGPQPGPGRWFEEDCDWSIVALAFPQFFTEDHQQAALETIKHYKPELYQQIEADRGRGA